jgi:hypothetical protein
VFRLTARAAHAARSIPQHAQGGMGAGQGWSDNCFRYSRDRIGSILPKWAVSAMSAIPDSDRTADIAACRKRAAIKRHPARQVRTLHFEVAWAAHARNLQFQPV